MLHPVLLLVDLANRDRESDWVGNARDFCRIHRVTSDDDVHARIKLICPQILAFEFARCDPAGLA